MWARWRRRRRAFNKHLLLLSEIRPFFICRWKLGHQIMSVEMFVASKTANWFKFNWNVFLYIFCENTHTENWFVQFKSCVFDWCCVRSNKLTLFAARKYLIFFYFLKILSLLNFCVFFNNFNNFNKQNTLERIVSCKRWTSIMMVGTNMCSCKLQIYRCFRILHILKQRLTWHSGSFIKKNIK